MCAKGLEIHQGSVAVGAPLASFCIWPMKQRMAMLFGD